MSPPDAQKRPGLKGRVPRQIHSVKPVDIGPGESLVGKPVVLRLRLHLGQCRGNSFRRLVGEPQAHELFLRFKRLFNAEADDYLPSLSASPAFTIVSTSGAVAKALDYPELPQNSVVSAPGGVLAKLESEFLREARDIVHAPVLLPLGEGIVCFYIRKRKQVSESPAYDISLTLEIPVFLL